MMILKRGINTPKIEYENIQALNFSLLINILRQTGTPISKFYKKYN